MSESQKLLDEQNNSESDSEPEHTPSPQETLSPASPSPSPSTSPSSAARRPDINGHGHGHGHGKRQSSFAQPRPDGAPRTPNRVRFVEDAVRRSLNGSARGDDWIELEGDDYIGDGDDYIEPNDHGHGYDYGRGGDTEGVQRLPLLTGIEAPSVTLATDDEDAEDHLESARPRSGLASAFMNMANSIMCVQETPHAACVCQTAG